MNRNHLISINLELSATIIAQQAIIAELEAAAAQQQARLEACRADNDALRAANKREMAATAQHVDAAMRLNNESRQLQQERDGLRDGMALIRTILREHGYTGNLADNVRELCEAAKDSDANAAKIAEMRRTIDRLNIQAAQRGARIGEPHDEVLKATLARVAADESKITRPVEPPAKLDAAG